MYLETATLESGMTYAEPTFHSRVDAVAALSSPDDRVVCDALLGITFRDPDWRWVQSECAELASHPSPAVRGLVATCLGHLARIRGENDRAVADPILDVLRADPDPNVVGRVMDALDDFHMYLRNAAEGPASSDGT